MAIYLRTTPQHAGGNHAGLIYRDTNGVELGIAVWDPARNQFCFHATPEDQVLSAADQTAILALLNGMTR